MGLSAPPLFTREGGYFKTWRALIFTPCSQADSSFGRAKTLKTTERAPRQRHKLLVTAR